MAVPSPSPYSLSSIFISHSRSFLSSSNPNLNPNMHKSLNTSVLRSLNLLRTFKSPIHCTSNNSPIETHHEPPPPPPKEQPKDGAGGGAVEVEVKDSLNSPPPKRSFAVATGELFIGIASRLVNFRGKKEDITENSTTTTTIPTYDFGEKSDDGERIAAVIEDSLEPEVLWEQREKDVEEEKRRKAVTSPGFSFSAAGLLFPYHLGVAQFLIENGYIKSGTGASGVEEFMKRLRIDCG